MTDKKTSHPTLDAPRVLSAEQVRQLLREGQSGRREMEARFERMERVNPKDAATRAR